MCEERSVDIEITITFMNGYKKTCNLLEQPVELLQEWGSETSSSNSEEQLPK